MANDLNRILKAEAKLLRGDARRLEVVAKHLRQRAKHILTGVKADETAEKARASFYAKASKVLTDTTLNPTDDFMKGVN